MTDAMVAIAGENMRKVVWVKISEVPTGERGIGGQPLTTEASGGSLLGRRGMGKQGSPLSGRVPPAMGGDALSADGRGPTPPDTRIPEFPAPSHNTDTAETSRSC